MIAMHLANVEVYVKNLPHKRGHTVVFCLSESYYFPLGVILSLNAGDVLCASVHILFINVNATSTKSYFVKKVPRSPLLI